MRLCQHTWHRRRDWEWQGHTTDFEAEHGLQNSPLLNANHAGMVLAPTSSFCFPLANLLRWHVSENPHRLLVLRHIVIHVWVLINIWAECCRRNGQASHVQHESGRLRVEGSLQKKEPRGEGCWWTSQVIELISNQAPPQARLQVALSDMLGQR